MSDKVRYVRKPSAESAGEAPGRGRLQGRKILVVGGGQRTFDAATDPVGNGRAMSLLFAREGAHVAVADMNRASAEDTVARIAAEGGQAFSIEANIAREDDVPFGRMATGWEIAYAALFFISDESVYVNAQTLAVDSGITGL
jgi:NAD(P)-dependent dehydrogenase (short-subunit alcohol dehydrogenase family)